MKGVTLYSGVSKFYFRHLLNQIINVGELRRPGISILDFGCGNGELKRILPDAKVIGFDIIPSLSDVEDWRPVDFDVLVANEVFYSFSENRLEELILELKRKNINLELIVGISHQGVLSNIGKYLLGKPDAHSATKTEPKKEVEILLRHCKVNRKKNVLHLAAVYSLSFKSTS